MAKKSLFSRIKITKNGKIKRRAMALSHNRGNKSSLQMMRKQKPRNLSIPKITMSRFV